MASGRVKVVGYAQRRFFDLGIEYRNYTTELVGQQQTTGAGEGLPYSLANIFDTEFSNEGRLTRDFITNKFSQFVTLTDIDLSEIKVTELIGNDSKLYLNLDKTKITNFAYFGSLAEYLRVSIENILINWPAAIYVTEYAPTYSVEDYVFDRVTDTTTFKVNVNGFYNPYSIDYTNYSAIISGNSTENSLAYSYSSTGITYGDYNISYSGGDYNIIGFTGSSDIIDSYVYIRASGNPFPTFTATTNGRVHYFIKPNEKIIETFFNGLNDFEGYLLNRYSNPIYTATFVVRRMTEDGIPIYTNESYTFPTFDGYNLAFEGAIYYSYAESLLAFAQEMDDYQTNILPRFLVSESITAFDSIPTCEGGIIENEGQKVTKTLRIYGREFDEIKKYTDGIALAHTVSYDKNDNLPDGLVKNLARTLGWDLTSSIINNNLLSSFMSPSETLYSGHSRGMSAFQSEIEFWRRLVLNTPWVWKSKGTRKAVEFLLKIIGTPQGLIDFNEYVYVAQNQIDMDVFNELLLLYNGNTFIDEIPITDDGFPSPLPNNRSMYFQNDGLWYRETAGSGATLDKLIGNNPHVGPYDGGSKYMAQFGCLIPSFTGATLSRQTVYTATTNLFTNYNSGTFNDIFSYDAIATCSSGNISPSIIYQRTLDDCLIGLDVEDNFSGDVTTECAVSGDWSVNLYINGNLSYDGPAFYQSTGFTGDYASSSAILSAITTAAESLGLEVTFEGKFIHFVQKAGFQLCENPNLIGLSLGIDICLDYTLNCVSRTDTFTGVCESCYTVCQVDFEEYGTNAEIYVDVFDVNNVAADGCYEITTEGIIDPFPAPAITECGCDESGCDNALRICIKERNDLEPNIIDACGIQGFTLDQSGLVLFTISGKSTYSVSMECCEAIGFTPVYDALSMTWECKWSDEVIVSTEPEYIGEELEIYSVDERSNLVTFTKDGEPITLFKDAESCKTFGFSPVSVNGGYNCYMK